MRQSLSLAFLLFMLAVLSSSCRKARGVDADYVTAKFEEHAAKLEKVEYDIHRIDTFPNGGMVWNNKGIALIEKDRADNLFGFSFYGKRHDIPVEFIYDKGMEFEINEAAHSYKIRRSSFGFMGSPGGQMISQNIFNLDSTYKSRKLIETENSFTLEYEFNDDTVYNETDIVKTLGLSKDNFFPNTITLTSKVLGARRFSQMILTNISINEQVESSIRGYKEQFKDYEVIQPEKKKPSRLIGTKFPQVRLPNLLDSDNVTDLTITTITLIDFWESWCGPCIVSLPKVENLKNRYPTDLQVVGIVSEDSETAIRVIDKKKTTFLNLVGNRELLKDFGITSWPTYFLIDQHGIIRKEYSGFSDQIEEDIKMLVEGH